MRSAALLVNLCRLPTSPHERLGLTLGPMAALVFDMSMMAAAMKVDAYDDQAAVDSCKGDPIGAATLVALTLRRGQRG